MKFWKRNLNWSIQTKKRKFAYFFLVEQKSREEVLKAKKIKTQEEYTTYTKAIIIWNQLNILNIRKALKLFGAKKNNVRIFLFIVENHYQKLYVNGNGMWKNNWIEFCSNRNSGCCKADIFRMHCLNFDILQRSISKWVNTMINERQRLPVIFPSLLTQGQHIIHVKLVKTSVDFTIFYLSNAGNRRRAITCRFFSQYYFCMPFDACPIRKSSVPMIVRAHILWIWYLHGA